MALPASQPVDVVQHMHQEHIAKVTENQMNQATPGGMYEDGVMSFKKPMPEAYRNVPFIAGFYQPFTRSIAQGGGQHQGFVGMPPYMGF